MVIKHSKYDEVLWINFTAILKQSNRNADTRRNCYNYIPLSQGTIPEFPGQFRMSYSQEKGISMKLCKMAQNQFDISQLEKVKNNNS